MFSEVRQTWFGYTEGGNRGSGLGRGFATAPNQNLHTIFQDFGNEKVAKGSHLEKLCLIQSGVGRNNVSDFTTNLIHGKMITPRDRERRDHLGHLRRLGLPTSERGHSAAAPRCAFRLRESPD
jgi:hypothetical protein